MENRFNISRYIMRQIKNDVPNIIVIYYIYIFLSYHRLKFSLHCKIKRYRRVVKVIKIRNIFHVFKDSTDKIITIAWFEMILFYEEFNHFFRTFSL